MNEAEKNIELTAENIEEVTGGVKSLSDLIFAGAGFIPGDYTYCPRCKSRDNIFKVVTDNAPPPDGVHVAAFFCGKCNHVFERQML